MADTSKIKTEPLPPPPPPPPPSSFAAGMLPDVIDVDSSDDSDSGEDGAGAAKRRRLEDLQVVLPVGFLDPLSPEEEPLARVADDGAGPPLLPGRDASRHSRQFWKAGDYDDDALVDSSSNSVSVTGMDHVRVHPRFLHSNATSHKWALGAFAELLDNAVDEVRNGAKSVKVDVLENKKVKGKMLLIEDDGGGMDPDKMRQCMSLGYSAKSKIANTIGQYGNGFKTSTMRLGADVIVFSRSNPKDGKRCTQSIGLLSYTFLTSTGKEDIIVPMISDIFDMPDNFFSWLPRNPTWRHLTSQIFVDYEKEGSLWKKINRNSLIDWQKNVETIVQWSPFVDEDDLLRQFNSIKNQGTRIIIYNLWEDDEAELELDFNADRHDIQIRGVNRDEKRIEMAQAFPNSRHYLTYQHSLRSYVSILYLRLPAGFKIYLRGKVVHYHNLVDDMMLTQEITYRPQIGADGLPKDHNMHAVVTIGFVKDAVHHIDIQGFNVYHKNRLIKPFWRVWNAAGSDGRGVIGVLEADFVEPAHDKQGFERTTALQRLETKLIHIQKQYWRSFCHKIGYARRSQGKEGADSAFKGNPTKGNGNKKSTPKCAPKNGVVHGKSASNCGRRLCSSSGSSSEDEVEGSNPQTRRSGGNRSTRQGSPCSPLLVPSKEVKGVHSGKKSSLSNGNVKSPDKNLLETENLELEDRLKKIEESTRLEIQIERDKIKSLEARVRELEQQLEQANKEQEALIDIFSDERIRRDSEEENLRIKLKEASKTIQDLLKKVKI